MDWKEFQENTKILTGIAAQKINEASDLAALHLRLKTLEHRNRALYEEFGKQSYRHFTTEEGNVETIAKFVEAITLSNREIRALKREIEARRSKKESTAVLPKQERGNQ